VRGLLDQLAVVFGEPHPPSGREPGGAAVDLGEHEARGSDPVLNIVDVIAAAISVRQVHDETASGHFLRYAQAEMHDILVGC
jgi:hypothetical protein